MRRWIVAALACACLALAVAPRAALADSGGWTYNPGAQTLTNGSVTLNGVTADDDNNLTIGVQSSFSLEGVREIDLSGSVTDAEGTSYSIISIGDYSFRYCQNLVSFTIPDSVQVIGGSAFSRCRSLGSINIPDSVKTIGRDAFSYCSALASVEIPDSVESIGTEAFFGCSSLVSVEIPGSVTSVGDYAFSYCTSLESVTLGDGVESIGGHAFSGCGSLGSVDIPGSVTSVGGYAFYDCSSLGSVTLGGGVKTIGDFAFYDCPSLSRVTVLATSIPALMSYPFDNVADDLVIVVPAGRLEKYKLSWDLYEDRLRPGYTLTVGGECVGTLHAEGDEVPVFDAAAQDACHPFAGWRVASGGGSLDGDVFTMGGSDAVLVASYDEHHAWGAGGHCTVCGETNPDFRPAITSGDGASWRKGEAGGLAFTSDAAYGDFERVLVDGAEVDRSLYTVEEGSTIVTLGAGFLQTLPEGEHAVTVVSSTGAAEARFTVLPAAGPGDDGTGGGATDGEANPGGGAAPDGGTTPGGSTDPDGGTAPGGDAGDDSGTGSDGVALGSGAEALAATGDGSLPAAVAASGAALAAAGALALRRRRG